MLTQVGMGSLLGRFITTLSRNPFHFAAVAILIIEPVPQIGFSCDLSNLIWTTGWLSWCFDLSSKPPKFERWSQRERLLWNTPKWDLGWLLSPLGSSSLHNAAAVIEAIWAAKKTVGPSSLMNSDWRDWSVLQNDSFEIWQKLFIKQSCQQNHSAAQIS